MANTLFSELAALCEALKKTKKRKEIALRVGSFLKGLPLDEVPLAVNLILGKAFPKRALDVSGASIIEILPDLIRMNEGEYAGSFSEALDFGEAVRSLFEKSGFVPSGEKLTIKSVSLAFKEIAEAKGPGSRKKKRELLLSLLRGASPLEAEYVVKNVINEMRLGVDEGMILEALSSTLTLDIGMLRRAMMLLGDIGEVARISVSKGAEELKKTGMVLFRPMKPMLAEMARSVSDVFDAMKDPFALEYKLDGARVQIHKKGDTCRLFSRNLTDITESFPDIVHEIVRTVQSDEAILEGEVIAVDGSGAPLPFQVLMRRLGRVRDLEKLVQEIPVRLYLFDILVKDGRIFIDMPYEDRWKALEQTSLSLAPRIIPATREEGDAFFRKAIEEGYEGVMAKALSSLYTPGVRGRAWLKIKKVLSLDLVITAADWGYGRRHGWLSNYLLAARDEKSGVYLPVGKTFKGLTDREFQEMTERLLNLKKEESRWTVSVRPDVVVEVLFSDVQKSTQYKSGFALRFARISRIRDDKSSREIDSIQTIEQIYQQQLQKQQTAA
jgi:DNA ligase-1